MLGPQGEFQFGDTKVAAHHTVLFQQSAGSVEMANVGEVIWNLGTPPLTKMDEFSKTSKRPLAPPPLVSENYVAFFFGRY